MFTPHRHRPLHRARRTRIALLLLATVGVASAVAAADPSLARAQDSSDSDNSEPPPIDPEVGLTGDDESLPDAALDVDASFEIGSSDNMDAPAGGALILAGKFGGGLPFNNLDVGVSGAVEVGYLFSRSDPSLGAYLDVSYFVPHSRGSNVDPRLSDITSDGDGAYSWHARQKELTFQPTFLYRLTMLSKWVVPYVGIGPRIYLLETVVDGKAGDTRFPVSREQSTKIGFGLPLGAEFTLGPGGIIAELLFQWGPLKHEITGDTHLGSASLWVGYRALL